MNYKFKFIAIFYTYIYIVTYNVITRNNKYHIIIIEHLQTFLS